MAALPPGPEEAVPYGNAGGATHPSDLVSCRACMLALASLSMVLMTFVLSRSSELSMRQRMAALPSGVEEAVLCSNAGDATHPSDLVSLGAC